MSRKEDQVDASGVRSLDPKHAAVALPAGGFDMDKLLSGIAKAHDSDNRDEDIGKAVESAAAEGTDLSPRDPAAMEGFKLVEVKREDLGITETVRLNDPEVETPAAEDATKAPTTSTAKRGESKE